MIAQPAPLRLAWQLREPPLPPVAALATGAAVGPLAAAALRRGERPTNAAPDPASGPPPALRAASADGVLLLLGEDLPWAAGVRYLGWARDQVLLLPTDRAPDLPVDLLVAAARQRFGLDDLIAVLPERILLLPRPRYPAEAARLAELVERET